MKRYVSLRRVAAFLIVMTLTVSAMNAGLSLDERACATAVSGTVYVPDVHLKEAINRALSAPADADISTDALAALRSLSADGYGIYDITGLEYCTGLEYLSLNENHISEISPLGGLPHLTHVYLDGNEISDFSALAGMNNSSSNLYIYARSQEAQGAGIIRTSEEITLSVPLRYRTGKTFAVSDFLPLGANGIYAAAAGTVNYKPFTAGTEASYRFDLEDETISTYRKSVFMGGRITHAVDIIMCDVTFDGAGGELSGKDKISMMQDYPLTEFPVATRKGYRFAGWRSVAGAAVEEGYIVTTSQAIKAAWTANHYRLFYEPGRGTVPAAYKEVTFDQAYGPLLVPVRTGYSFSAWYLDLDGKHRVDQNTVHQKEENTTIYAIWNPNSYQITFDAQGGTLPYDRKTVTYDDIYGQLPQPKRKEMRFEGWYTASSGGERIAETDDVTFANDQRLFAHWSKIKKPPALLPPAFADTWKTIDGYRYHFDKKGLPMTGLRKIGKHYYFFDSIGRMQKGRVIALSGYKLRLNKKGHVTNMPRPNRTTVTRAKMKKGGKIEVRWHGLIGADGYQLQYALDKKFKKEIGLVTVKGGKNTAVLSHMAKGKRYYVRVRGYFKVGSLRIPGKYSKSVHSN